MSTLSLTDRHQITFMSSLDDAVAADNPVRLLDALIDRIILENPDYYNHLSADGSDGRPGYPGPAMIKLYIYGYINGINSCRKLQVECQRNIEVIWLMHGLKPCFKTIASYARNNPDQLDSVNEQIVRFMYDHDWIKGQRIAIDGTKLKAYTGWKMYDHQSLDKKLQKSREQLDQWIAKLLADPEEPDCSEQSDEFPPFDDGSQVMDQIEQLQEKIDKLEDIKRQLDAQQCKMISPADPEARSMHTAKHSSPPSYNLQIAVDDASKMLVSTRLTQKATDFEQLQPNYQAITSRLGIQPDVMSADTGYADLGDVKEIESKTKTIFYIPENNTPAKNRPITFTYEPEHHQYRCSQGQPLPEVGKTRYVKRKKAYVQRFRGTECRTCKVASTCTSSKSGLRTLHVYHGAKWRYAYAKRLKTRQGKKELAARKGIVEHPFGTLKYWMGQIPLKHRGLDSCQTQIAIYTSAYNIKRWCNLDSFKNLMKQVSNWKPTQVQVAV